MNFHFYKQLNAMDCGPTALRMVAKYYGKHYNTDGIRETAGYGKQGVSLLGLSDAAEKIGFRTRGVQLSYNQLINEAPLPCILHWNQNHFVVVHPKSFPKERAWGRLKTVRLFTSKCFRANKKQNRQLILHFAPLDLLSIISHKRLPQIYNS